MLPLQQLKLKESKNDIFEKEFFNSEFRNGISNY